MLSFLWLKRQHKKKKMNVKQITTLERQNSEAGRKTERFGTSIVDEV